MPRKDNSFLSQEFLRNGNLPKARATTSGWNLTDLPGTTNLRATRFLPMSLVSLSQGIPLFRAEIPEHCCSQKRICARLVPFTLASQPRDDIGVKSKRQLLFYGSIKWIADRILPEFFGKLRNVGCIDFFIGPLGKLFQSSLLSRSYAAIQQNLLYDFRHSGCVPSELPFELK
jgi:hypothetical protein